MKLGRDEASYLSSPMQLYSTTRIPPVDGGTHKAHKFPTMEAGVEAVVGLEDANSRQVWGWSKTEHIGWILNFATSQETEQREAFEIFLSFSGKVNKKTVLTPKIRE